MKLFILILSIACTYSVSAETVDFIQQPMTDKQCYKEGENGTLKLSYRVTGTTPVDFYRVVLTANPDGTGGVKINGTEIKFYDTLDRDTKHARFRVTMSSVNRTMEYRLDASSLESHDETDPLYAVIIESHSGKFMNKSSVGARFYVNGTCLQRLQPTMSSVTNKVKGDSNQDHTSDPKEPSTATAPPNNDSTSTGCIPAKPTIPEVFCTSFYILLAICLGILVIFIITGVILYWFCIKRKKPKPKKPKRKRRVYRFRNSNGLGSLRNGNLTL